MEGQLASTQTQLEMAIKIRDDLAQELFKCTNEIEELKKENQSLSVLKEENQEIQSRYD
jgi:hypothetical protein